MGEDLNKNQSNEVFINAEDINKEIFYTSTNDNSIKIENIHLNYKSMMEEIFRLWIEDCVKEDRYPFDVLIPLPFIDIKLSERGNYWAKIMEIYNNKKNEK